MLRFPPDASLKVPQLDCRSRGNPEDLRRAQKRLKILRQSYRRLLPDQRTRSRWQELSLAPRRGKRLLHRSQASPPRGAQSSLASIAPVPGSTRLSTSSPLVRSAVTHRPVAIPCRSHSAIGLRDHHLYREKS